MEATDDNFFDDGADDELLAASEDASASPKVTSMTTAQKSRSEKNRMKALALKKARLIANPYPNPKSKEDFLTGEKITKEKETKLVDTNAGFFIEETEGGETSTTLAEPLPAPVVQPDRPECEECQEALADSYLFRNFDLDVCDKCKNTEKDGKHELITKTDAKNEFILKDLHFDTNALRECGGVEVPALKFIVRKNPHNQTWGDMKLYLRMQVEKRALEVWGTEEALEEEHEKREDRRDQLKVKKFNKKLKALKMQVRGSLYKKVDISVHEHEYGEEVYDEDEDQYSRTCKTCNHVHSYEKM